MNGAVVVALVASARVAEVEMPSTFGSFAIVGSLFFALPLAACAAPTEAPDEAAAGSEDELAKKSCKLFVDEPSIKYIRSDGIVLDNPSNPVNARVLERLEQNGFVLADRRETATLTMQTEVRCGPTQSIVWFMPVAQDACQTEVRFVKRATDKVLNQSRTVAKPGLNIDFEAITWPKCKDL
jgi:hypothetical protein